MKLCALTIVSSWLALGSAFGQQAPAASHINSGTGKPVGVLLGFKLVAEPGRGAGNDTGQDVRYRGDTEPRRSDDPTIISRSNQSEAESPFETAWIQITSDQVKVQWLQDAIVPRNSGFWRFGENTDSVRTNRGLIQEDYFWAAPLGKTPKLATVDHPEECDGEARRLINEVVYLGPSYVARSTMGTSESDCFQFASSSVVSLDHLEGQHVVMSEVFGPTVREKLKQINRQVWRLKPKDDEDCGQDGWETDEEWWTLKHAEGQWRALVELIPRGRGGTLCRVISKPRALDMALPASLVPSNTLPVAWKEIKRAFPEATDAFASPGGEVVLLVAPNKILVVRSQLGKLSVFYSFAKPNAVPVMAEWTLGTNVARWDQTLSKLPGPSPAAKPRAERSVLSINSK